MHKGFAAYRKVLNALMENKTTSAPLAITSKPILKGYFNVSANFRFLEFPMTSVGRIRSFG